jgi:hypothetical protein
VPHVHLRPLHTPPSLENEAIQLPVLVLVTLLLLRQLLLRAAAFRQPPVIKI